MDFGEKLEEKLKKLIEKYGKRETPLPYNNKVDENEDNSKDYEDESEEYEDNEQKVIEDKRQYEYYFHYDKRKDETFAFNEDFKIKKDKTSKHELHIIFYDDKIVNDLREILEEGDLYNDPAEMAVEDLYHCIHNFRIKYNEEKYHNDGVKRVLDFVNELFYDKYNKMDNMINENVIDFESLWYYLDKVNTIYKITYFDEELCFKYNHFAFDYSPPGQEILILVGTIIAPYNGTLNVYTMEYNMKKFNGTKKLDTLKITKLNESEYKMFNDYGTTVLNSYKTINHMQMSGKQLIKQERGILTRERHERVMVDYEGMSKYSNNPYDFFLEKTIEQEEALTSIEAPIEAPTKKISQKTVQDLMDETGQEILSSQKEQIEKEINQFKLAIEDNIKGKQNYEDQWRIDEELWELQLKGDNYKLITVAYKYQEVERYWELVKKKLEYKYREDKKLAEGRLLGFDKQKEIMSSELASLESKLKEIVGDDNGTK